MDRPGVGVGVIVLNARDVLIGRRSSKHGNGTWGFPGGKLEMWETIEECARRETMEEAGIEITDIRYAAFTNDTHKAEGLHYVTLFVTAALHSGEPTPLQANEIEVWRWIDWYDLKEIPLFMPIQSLLRSGYDPFQ